MFIVFEGLDGSGSSTQSRLLAQKLEANGHAVFMTKEPTGDSPIGRMIRDVLQHKWEASPEALQLLFCADRAEHLKKEIEPALKNGQIVISDRYFFSTIAYGSLALNDGKWLKALNQPFRLPDLTFLLKLDPKICLERIHRRENDVELFEKQEKLEQVWQNYESLINDYDNIHVIDTNRSKEVTSEEIWGIVSKHL